MRVCLLIILCVYSLLYTFVGGGVVVESLYNLFEMWEYGSDEGLNVKMDSRDGCLSGELNISSINDNINIKHYPSLWLFFYI